MVMVYRHSWCRCSGWHGGYTYGTGWTALRKRIPLQWCWLHLWFVGRACFPILTEVVAHIFDGGVFVFLDLLLCLFFFCHRGFYGDPLGVLRVSLLLHDCSASWRTRLDTQPIWALLFFLLGPNNLLCCDCNYDGICSIWSFLTLALVEAAKVVLLVPPHWKPPRGL